MKSILIILFTFYFSLSKGQSIKHLKNREDSIQILIQKISVHNVLSSLLVGSYMQTVKMQYERFVYLLSLANNEDLIALLDSSKGCIRVYAFMGLYHNKYQQIEQLKQQLNNDTTQIKVTGDNGLRKIYTVANAIKYIHNWYSEEYTNMILASISNSKLENRSVMFEHLLNASD